MNEWRRYLWRVVFTILGIITAILFMALGFAKTMLILLCCCVGYVIGLYADKKLSIPKWTRIWRNKW